MAVHTTYFQRPNGDDEDIEIEVEFTLKGGHDGAPPSWNDPGEPGEPPEFEIVGCEIVSSGEATELTSDEQEKVEAEIYGRLGDFDDGDFDESDYE